MNVDAQDILAFWFREATPEQWFAKDDQFDAQIKSRFSSVVARLAEQIETEGVTNWEGTPKGSLASVLVLDQFPRNIFRGTPQAFAFDDKAREVAQRLIDVGGDMDLTSQERQFLYLPYMHVEDLDAQEFCVELFKTRLEDQSQLSYAVDHRDIIQRFGRFPHRNAILGRLSTEAELAFLADGGFAG